jgi:hypothetical protein
MGTIHRLPVVVRLRGSTELSKVSLDIVYLFERRQVAGAVPNAFLKAREKAASDP